MDFPKLPKKNGHKIWKMELRLDFKNLLLYGLTGLFFFLAVASFFGGNKAKNENTVPVSRILADAKEDKIEKIAVSENDLTVKYKDGKTVFSRKDPNQDLNRTLFSKDELGLEPGKVILVNQNDITKNFWVNAVLNFGPILMFFFLLSWLYKRQMGGANALFSFGQSPAKNYQKNLPKVTFAAVAGVDEAKKELEEIVDFLKNPKKYAALGARTPKGVLLIGPSGCGKTLLARAVAGEAGVAFYSMAGSEFMEMLVGIGASVTGDTTVLIRQNGEYKLLPIGEFADQYYKNEDDKGIKIVEEMETLGFEKKKTGFWGTKNQTEKMVFAKSAFKKVSGVYRHRVSEIYEIEYLDGIVRATGDHSVFIRTHGWIKSIPVAELKPGDLLVNLPLNVRHWDKEAGKTVHELKTHEFEKLENNLYLDFWSEDKETRQKYQYVFDYQGVMTQSAIAANIGVSQATVGHWQNKIYSPQLLSRKLVKLDLPDRVKITPELLKLFGFYTAEGRNAGNLELTFGADEQNLHEEFISLMEEVFGVGNPKIENTIDNSTRIIYYSAHLGRFFERSCGTGSHNKHLPNILWELPKEYFLAYLEGLYLGDRYITKSQKLSITSVSHQLIKELSWLCAMHGIKAGVKHGTFQAGRVIKNKPLPAGEYWNLIIGKTSNPFVKKSEHPWQIKRAIVKKITKKRYDGFVYDLVGVENEAFFGGDKPVLLHNSRVRDLFQTAKKSAPSIIFIDEIDAIGRQRGMGLVGGHDEREQTLNQILVEMDGFQPNESVIVMAATNRPDVLDPALVRPGRFDRRVSLDLPDKEGRLAILEVHKKGKPFVDDADWEKVAKRTVGFSGADLENMLNEAAILAAREAKTKIDMKDLEEAATKVKMGPEKKRLQSDQDKKITAYHEAGHAVVTHFLPHMDPVHRISIVSRGMSLGHTLIPPTADRLHETKSHLVEQIASMLGGRAAEELIFKEMTTGASSDISQATAIAREMVTEFGMSALGPINLDGESKQTMGRYFFEPTKVSENMTAKIDAEVKKLIDDGLKLAQSLLKKHKKLLDKVAAALLAKETLEREEFEEIMGHSKTI